MRDRVRAIRPAQRWLLGILVLSVLLRVAVALYYGDTIEAPPLLTDQRSYHVLGARLISGDGFSFDRPWYPFTPADTPTAHWSFLYALFVAGIYALAGVHPLAVRLVQAVLGGILLPWMVYRLARQMGADGLAATGQRMALRPQASDGPSFSPECSDVAATEGWRGRWDGVPVLAAFVAAVYGYFVLYAATVMTETFFIIAVLWSLEKGLELANRLRSLSPGQGATQGRPHGHGGLACSLGLSFAMATLLRQSFLPWVPVLVLYVVWTARRAGNTRPAAAALGIALAILAAAILPWTVRNVRVYGRFLLLNSNAGYAMYSAQHPMHGTSFREFDAAPLPDDLPRGNEAQMDQELMRAGIRMVVDDPGRYLLLSLSRVRAYFEFWPTRDTTLLHNVGRSASFGLFLPFMLYGLVIALRHRGFAARNALVFLFVVTYSLLHLLTWAMVRYRLPVDAVLVVFAAVAGVDLVHVLINRGRASSTDPFHP